MPSLKNRIETLKNTAPEDPCIELVDELVRLLDVARMGYLEVAEVVCGTESTADLELMRKFLQRADEVVHHTSLEL